ncbi:phosphoglycerate dehydrogenase [Metabacillus arenae]|uniref:Phosphoglycerate dehydrogenase n=1 Tax=Metabacillus arenae TaxID=2771434 RepID=A0A926NJC9_9BACI|nr:phosphoglycerate dehydrogenase [Metabacillus arenae]MBD1382421.1 phosphoglycerate dehydrogenase [Metabacillus arenae]
MKKALLTLSSTFYYAYPELEERIKGLGIDLNSIVSDEPLSKERVIEEVKDVEIYIVGVESIDKDVIDAAKNLKYIIKQGAGVDNIDIAYALSKGIQVTNAPAQNATSVADLALGLTLAVARHIPESNQVIKSGGWKLIMGNDLEGKSLGIIGFGAIGRKIAQRANGFDMKIYAYDPFQDKEAAKKLNVTYLSLDELYRISDFVIISTSLNKDTYGLVDMNSFKSMKDTAYLINTARGEIVNESDLIEALKNNEIAGAALDVYHSEPPNVEIIKFPNVITTSHIGGSTYEAAKKIGDITVSNLYKYLKSETQDFILQV